MSRQIYAAVEDGGEGQEYAEKKSDVVPKAEEVEKQGKKAKKLEKPEAHAG